MLLAWQSAGDGGWDLEAFSRRLSARTMTRWSNWLSTHPQGQKHRDEMLASVGAAICATQSSTVSVDDLMIGYPSKPPLTAKEKQAEIDSQFLSVRHLIPKAT